MRLHLTELKSEIKTFLESIAYELYDVELVKENKETILRIYIDKPKGILMDDVLYVTQQMNPWIDALDPLEEGYMLEVSSPGAERELRSKEAIKNAVNRLVYVETFTQKIEGDLIGFDGDILTLVVKNKKIKMNYIDVNLIRLAIDFRRRK